MIRLLGRPRAGAAQARGNKPWAIAAYLALAGGPVSRDRLITLLFDDADDPAGALRWNLGQVRRLLGQPDALRGRVLSLRGADVAFDVDLLTTGRWQDVVELPGLGGELLEGLQFPHSPAYEVWLLGERRRLAAATETLLQEAALSAISTGKLADAVRWANRLVCLNPWVDSHQELLIRAYAISGDQAAARRQLESAVRLFRRELSCDPAPAVFLAAETSPVKATGPASPARVHALVEAGRAQVAAGATEAAIQVMHTACDEAARTGIAALEATAQLALGATLIDAGTARRQDGELALHRAIALAEASGQPRLAASAYRYMAGSDVLSGFYSRADRLLAAAEAIAVPGLSEQVELAAIRGVSVLDQGDPVGAISVFGVGLAADPDRAHPFLPIMLAHAGRAHLLAGELPAARAQLEDAVPLARRADDPRAQSWHDEALATAQRSGMRSLTRELLQPARSCSPGWPCSRSAGPPMARGAGATGPTARPMSCPPAVP